MNMRRLCKSAKSSHTPCIWYKHRTILDNELLQLSICMLYIGQWSSLTNYGRALNCCMDLDHCENFILIHIYI